MNTPAPTGAPRPMSITPEEKGRILAELKQLRADFSSIDRRLDAIETRSTDRFNLLHESVKDLSEGFQDLRTDLKVNEKVDETQNTQIAQVQAKLSTKDKAVLGGLITVLITIAELIRPYIAAATATPQ